MPKDMVVIFGLTAPVRVPIKMHRIIMIALPAVVPICPPPIDELKGIINKKDNAMRMYDFDKIHLEAKKDQIDRRERVRFQNINARIQSKIAQRTYQNKKQKGK